MRELTDIEKWLTANKDYITHFRPRRWCGVATLTAYNRNNRVPFIDGQPQILDNDENAQAIRFICGAGFIEERHGGIAGSNNY